MTREPVPGDMAGAWRLETLLGKGAFGATWRAVDALGRVAAVKLLSEPPGDEVRALAGFSHPAIPTLFDAQGAPSPYVAMELAVGRPLSEMLRRGRAPASAALQLIAVMADALAHVHDAGLVHGDVKPENILVDHIGDLRMWLVDFGACGQPGAGTLHYASPERMRGAPATPAADVYALGLVLWEIIHGGLPWFDEGISTALTRRGAATPDAVTCDPWVRELLSQMLAPEGELRPSAGFVADILESHGFRLPQPDGSSILRRAHAVHVPVPAVDRAVAGWLANGGALAVVGAAGTGRSHVLHQAEVELRARGIHWIRLEMSSIPWQAARRALTTAELSGPEADLPDEPDLNMRARQVAEMLASRAGGPLWVVADDLERHPEDVALLAAAIAAQDGLHLLVAGTTVPPWMEQACMLAPMGTADLGSLVTRILGGDASASTLVQHLHPTLGGFPGRWVCVLSGLCDARVLIRRARRWLLDVPRLHDFVAELPPFGGIRNITLTGWERDVAGLVAVSETPLAISTMADLLHIDPTLLTESVQALVMRRLVVADGAQLRMARQDQRSAVLQTLGDEVRHLHRMLAQLMHKDGATAVLELAHHALASEDTALIISVGPDSLTVGSRVDPQHAARLAIGMWRAAPDMALAGPVVESLVAAGRVDEARTIGQEQLDASPEGSSLQLLRAMARLKIHVDEEPDVALALLAKARALLARNSHRPSLSVRLLEAQAHFAAGRFSAAEAVARAACATPVGTSVEGQEAWVTLHGTWAQAVHKLGDVDSAIAILDDVPENVARGRPCRALLQGMRGRLLWHAGRVREAADVLEAGADANSGLPALQRARMLNNAGLASYQCGDRRAALERWEGALLLCERLGAQTEVNRLNINLCVAYTEDGRWERARCCGEQGHAGARDSAQPDLEAMAAGNLGDLAFHRGLFEDAEHWYELASDLAEAHGIDAEKVELARRRAEVAVRRKTPEASTLATAARKVAEKAGDLVEAGRARMLQLVCRARESADDASLLDGLDDEVQSILDDLKNRGLGGHLAVARTWAAELELELGRAADALKTIDAVAMYAVEVGNVPLRKRAEELRALAKEREQRDPRAGRFERMIALATTVTREQDPNLLLDAIASAGLELMDGDRCFVLLMEGDEPQVERVKTAEGAQVAHAMMRPSSSVVAQVVAQRRPVIANDILERGDLREARSVAALALRAAMCVPMADGDELLGMIYVDSQRQSERQLSEATQLMSALASHAAVALSHARHIAEISLRAHQAAEVAHDLRSPLASVISLVQEVQDEAQEYGGQADARYSEMLVLLRRAVSMAELLLDGRRGKIETVDVADALNALCQSLDRRARVSGVRVVPTVPAGIFVRIVHDELLRVVGNLINNALKFSPTNGTIHVVVRVVSGQAEISVRDEGGGIPANLLGRLFERGVKSSDERGGHGLGLAIVDRLVRDAGGRVAADNHPQGGAVFTVTLPCSTDAAEQSAAG